MVAGGKSATAAYRKIYSVSQEAANPSGARLLANVSVSARVKEIKERTAELIELSKAQLLDQYAEAFMTPGDKVKPGARIIEGVEIRVIGKKVVKIYKLMSKVDAGREIAKMCGYYEAEKHNVTITNVNKLVRGIMHGKEWS